MSGGDAGAGMLTYFAYGSNLCLARLRDRVPGVVFRAVAVLPDYGLRWHKLSADGSGKCSIERSGRGEVVWGGLFHLPVDERPRLDRVEGLGSGYDERVVTVRVGSEEVEAYTYAAAPSHIMGGLRPFSWYHDLVVAGATSLGLPGDYVEGLRGIETIDDPDLARDAANRTAIPCLERPDSGDR